MSKTIWKIGMTLKELERNVIEKSLRFYDGNKTKVAASLGVSVKTIDNKLKLYEVVDATEKKSSSKVY